LEVSVDGSDMRVQRSALVRTARKLMRGEIFVPSAAWSDDP
jgi:4-oxalomesaconate tautomerase